MSIENINVNEAIDKAKKLLDNESNISPALKASFEMLILLVGIMVNKFWLNSSNSSKPPSTDPNRLKRKKKWTWKKQGGQNGRTGKTLEKVPDPDEVIDIKVDRSTLPKWGYWKYKTVWYESRQEFDVDISVVVKEYRAEILENEKWDRITAKFPEWIKAPTQYWNWTKSHSVYLSQYQLLPYDRVWEYFEDQCWLPLSVWTVNNYNNKAYDLLEDFESTLKTKLLNNNESSKDITNHADETWVNINGKRHWLHWLSNNNWTYLYPHEKRWSEAMDEMWVLPYYKWRLCHDYWKSYYNYEDVTHILCNAHILRELEAVYEQDKHKWWKSMQDFLLELNEAVENNWWELHKKDQIPWLKKYQRILNKAQKQCPPPDMNRLPDENWKKKRWRTKRTKARNLLDRFINRQEEILAFMTSKDVPFTNNLWERDIRMTKVHQKISWCFRSMNGAKTFCRIRSYLSSARKQWFTASHALKSLFDGKNIFA
jgi:transposase